MHLNAYKCMLPSKPTVHKTGFTRNHSYQSQFPVPLLLNCVSHRQTLRTEELCSASTKQSANPFPNRGDNCPSVNHTGIILPQWSPTHPTPRFSIFLSSCQFPSLPGTASSSPSSPVGSKTNASMLTATMRHTKVP